MRTYFLLAMAASLTAAPNASAQARTTTAGAAALRTSQQNSPVPQPTPKQILPPPPPAELLKKTVVFLSTSFHDGDWAGEIRGTAFFVGYKEERMPDRNMLCFLVTNRHMIEPSDVQGHHSVAVDSFSVRMNLKSVGPPQTITVIMPAQSTRWYFPSDEAVDLAVLPGCPDLDKIDVKPFPVSMFATKEKLAEQRVAEGDAVLFTGFFAQFPGTKRVEPIVRQGVLAMLPTEEMLTTRRKAGHLYLADAHVFGGNSGSPMFVNTGRLMTDTLEARGGFPFQLLGVVSGYIHESADFSLEVARTLTGTVDANSGVATVVPVDDLKALLDIPDLQRIRDLEVERRKTESPGRHP